MNSEDVFVALGGVWVTFMLTGLLVSVLSP